MKQETKDLIDNTIEMFERTTGLKAVHQYKLLKAGQYPDGLIRIDQQNRQWVFTVQVNPRVTRTIAALAKAEQGNLQEDRILVTQYVTPPIADLMKEHGLFFLDAAGNAYINKFPLYVFIKGNKPPQKARAVPARRLFKPGGLKVVFALLNHPDTVNQPYREIAAMADVALGTVGWVFFDLKEMGFLVERGERKRTMTEVQTLLKRWTEAYPDHLRPKLVIERFKADQPRWWEKINILDYHACWGAEVAAAQLTKRLKPERVVIYADEPPGKLIIENKLRKAADGDVEILKPFWKFDHALAGHGIAPPLLVYADLMATGDARNIETAGIIYDKYLARLGR
jgi:hypothetical protein